MAHRHPPTVLLALSASLLLSGCFLFEPGPKVASAARDLTLDMMPDQETANAFLATLRDEVELDKDKVTVREVQGSELAKVKRCFMKYTIGETDWGIVPGATWDCADDEAEKHHKKAAKEWLEASTESGRIVSEAEFLRSTIEPVMEAVASANGAGFDLNKCVDDAIDVLVDIEREVAEERCAVVTTGVDLEDVLRLEIPQVGDGEENPQEKLVEWARGLELEEAVPYLFLEKSSYARACWNKRLLSEDDLARTRAFGDAIEICGKAAAAAGR